MRRPASREVTSREATEAQRECTEDQAASYERVGHREAAKLLRGPFAEGVGQSSRRLLPLQQRLFGNTISWFEGRRSRSGAQKIGSNPKVLNRAIYPYPQNDRLI